MDEAILFVGALLIASFVFGVIVGRISTSAYPTVDMFIREAAIRNEAMGLLRSKEELDRFVNERSKTKSPGPFINDFEPFKK